MKLATKNSVTIGYVVLGTFVAILLLVVTAQLLVQSSLSLTAANIQVIWMFLMAAVEYQLLVVSIIAGTV